MACWLVTVLFVVVVLAHSLAHTRSTIVRLPNDVSYECYDNSEVNERVCDVEWRVFWRKLRFGVPNEMIVTQPETVSSIDWKAAVSKQNEGCAWALVNHLGRPVNGQEVVLLKDVGKSNCGNLAFMVVQSRGLGQALFLTRQDLYEVWRAKGCPGSPNGHCADGKPSFFSTFFSEEEP